MISKAAWLKFRLRRRALYRYVDMCVCCVKRRRVRVAGGTAWGYMSTTVTLEALLLPAGRQSQQSWSFFLFFFFKNTRLGTNKMHPSPCVLPTAGLRTREKNTVAPPVLRTEPTSGACAKRTF